ncbi:MAG: SDR family oxidoreductase, partial [Novosphingobium sp.]|nr:SDR family oxidoreductase [Novosphingobium sp.]
DIIPQHIARSAIKRVATVEEQGDLVVFLASDRARFITGQLIAVDGGLGAQPLSDISSITRAALAAEFNDRALGL